MDKTVLIGLEKLNQLRLTEAETEAFLTFYAALNDAERAMNAIATDDVPPTVHLVSLTNVFREDVSAQAFTREALQAGAPECMDGYWQVPRLVD